MKEQTASWLIMKMQEMIMKKINRSQDIFQKFIFYCTHTASWMKIMNTHIQKNWNFADFSAACSNSHNHSKRSSDKLSFTYLIKKKPGARSNSKFITDNGHNWLMWERASASICLEHGHLFYDSQEAFQLRSEEHEKKDQQE